jgi:hypothetical protein
LMLERRPPLLKYRYCYLFYDTDFSVLFPPPFSC